MLSPVENLPVTIFPSSAINEFNQQVEEMDRNRERIVVTHQVKKKVPFNAKSIIPASRMAAPSLLVVPIHAARCPEEPILLPCHSFNALQYNSHAI